MNEEELILKLLGMPIDEQLDLLESMGITGDDAAEIINAVLEQDEEVADVDAKVNEDVTKANIREVKRRMAQGMANEDGTEVSVTEEDSDGDGDVDKVEVEKSEPEEDEVYYIGSDEGNSDELDDKPHDEGTKFNPNILSAIDQRG